MFEDFLAPNCVDLKEREREQKIKGIKQRRSTTSCSIRSANVWVANVAMWTTFIHPANKQNSFWGRKLLFFSLPLTNLRLKLKLLKFVRDLIQSLSLSLSLLLHPLLFFLLSFSHSRILALSLSRSFPLLVLSLVRASFPNKIPR